MSVTWYLIKHVPDLRRREPKNVGVILQTPDGWFSRFLAEEADGSIDGRRLNHSQIKTEAYKTWVSYFRRKASDDCWPDVDRLQKRRVGNYFAEIGGHLLREQDSWKVVLDRLYIDLVEATAVKPVQRATPLDRLLLKVDSVFNSAGIQPLREIRVPAKFGESNRLTEVPFRFSFQNGHEHLMDVVHEHTPPDKAAAEARELRARVDAARNADSSRTFVTFYASSILDVSNIDDVLYPVEAVSDTVDVDQKGEAVSKIRSLMGD